MSIAPVNTARRTDPHIEQRYSAQKGMFHDKLPTSAGIAKTNNARVIPSIIDFFISVSSFN